MTLLRRSPAAVAASLAAAVFVAAACGQETRGKFEDGPTFGVDASVDAPPPCGLRCSIDGRAVVQECTGEVVETCPPELACGAGACMEPCAAAVADPSSHGCAFYLQPPRFSKLMPYNCYAAFVVNASLQPARIALEIEGKSLDLTKSTYRTSPGTAELTPHEGDVAPGESVVIFISDRHPDVTPSPWEELLKSRAACPKGVVPVTYTDGFPDGTGLGWSYRLSSNVPVSTTTIYPFGGIGAHVPTATLILPVGTWAKEHMLVNGWSASSIGFGGSYPAAQIIASEDDTEVTLVPKRDVQPGIGVIGGRADTPLKYRLAKGQHLQLYQAEELTGSTVSSNKPTSVVGGHHCANIGNGACEILAQQIPAYEQWGAEYVAVGYRPRLGNEHEPLIYRMVAARDGTRLDYDPAIPAGAPVALSAGESALFEAGAGDAFVVRTQDVDHPIYLAAYMTGAETYGDQGDPEFVNVVPSKQYMSSYAFYADPSYAETSLVVVRAKSGGTFHDVWLECAGNLTKWSPVGTRGEYEFARVDLQRRGGPGETFGTTACQVGLQRMRSEGPFTATLWGWGYYASYAYPGGMAHRKLVEVPLTVH